MTTDAKRNIAHIKRFNIASENISIILPIFHKTTYQNVIQPYNNYATLLEYQITTLLHNFPKADIFIVLGYNADKILAKLYDKFSVRFINNHIYQSTNLAYGISLAIQASNRSAILTIHGNIIFNQSITRIISNQSSVLLSPQNYNTTQVGVFVRNNLVTNFAYSLPQKWCGIAYLVEKELALYKNLCFDYKNHMMLDYEILNKIVDHGGKIYATL